MCVGALLWFSHARVLRSARRRALFSVFLCSLRFLSIHDTTCSNKDVQKPQRELPDFISRQAYETYTMAKAAESVGVDIMKSKRTSKRDLRIELGENADSQVVLSAIQERVKGKATARLITKMGRLFLRLLEMDAVPQDVTIALEEQHKGEPQCSWQLHGMFHGVTAAE
uniref:Putative secreted protein n=1 Tax=Anopheles triannulatus TaxID=58253 RepID=A0A2M4B5X3_9DIPT